MQVKTMKNNTHKTNAKGVKISLTLLRGIKLRVKGLNLSQGKIARLAGVSKQTVSNFFNGKFLKKSEPQNKLINWLLENNLIVLKKITSRAKCQCPDCGAIHTKSHPFKIKARRGGTGL